VGGALPFSPLLMGTNDRSTTLAPPDGAASAIRVRLFRCCFDRGENATALNKRRGDREMKTDDTGVTRKE